MRAWDNSDEKKASRYIFFSRWTKKQKEKENKKKRKD